MYGSAVDKRVLQISCGRLCVYNLLGKGHKCRNMPELYFLADSFFKTFTDQKSVQIITFYARNVPYKT